MVWWYISSAWVCYDTSPRRRERLPYHHRMQLCWTDCRIQYQQSTQATTASLFANTTSSASCTALFEYVSMSSNWPGVLSVRIISTGMSCCCSWSYSVLMKSSSSFRVRRQTLTVNCFRPTLQLFGRRWRWWHGVGVDLDYVLDSKWLELRFVLLTM